MSYLKMLGLAGRGKLPAAAALFSTAVISGSSSAPNLRDVLPPPAGPHHDTALEGFGGVPAIRPLETLHNALSLRQLDLFLERVIAAPVVLGWSGPSSLMSSSGELPSGLSSAGPSSPNSNTQSDHKNFSDRAGRKLPQWDGETALDCLHPALCPAPGSVSGDVTPVSTASELDFNSNEATAGSITDQDPMSAGEDDEETLSVYTWGSPVRTIRNDLSPNRLPYKVDEEQPSTSKVDFYGLSLQETKENLHKDMPSNSKNYNIENATKSKCTKGESCASNLSTLLNEATKGVKDKGKRQELLNNGSRRYSDSSAQKSSAAPPSRFTTTRVREETLRRANNSDHNNETIGS